MSQILRIVTYNTHGCVGTDGTHSVERIAEVLRELNADVYCLQEMDVGRGRSNSHDQPRLLAEALGMRHIFFPSFEVDGGFYGNAILSAYPFVERAAEALPYRPSGEIKAFRWALRRGAAEVRSALAVDLRLPDLEVTLINTHLTIDRRERMLQVQELQRWVASSSYPVILCGDFNTTPRAPHYKLLAACLRDVQQRHQATFHSRITLSPIDHIFADEVFQVRRVEVLKNSLTKLASDHLPLLAELEVS